MAQWSFPFADNSGDRVYGDVDFALFYDNLFADGVIATVGNGLRVEQPYGGGMNIVVKSGAAILGGRQYYNTEDLAVSVPIASTVQDRTDSVVVRLDLGSRAITLAYKQGDTTVQQDEVVYELQLATVNVGKNTVNIFNANVTDKRADESVCGYSSPYDKVSVSGLEQQYSSLLQQSFDDFINGANDNQTDLEQLLTDQQTTFQTWFSGLQNQLDDNQAGNLQSQLDSLKPTEQTFTLVHNFGYYPGVQVLFWRYGLGSVPLESQPVGISWDGESPRTIPFQIEHVGRNELNIKVPLQNKMSNPVITETNEHEYLLIEGINSMQIKIEER